GRCCYWDDGKQSRCVDHVSSNECAQRDVSAFQVNEECPQEGGAACPACAIDAQCDDGVFCNGAEFCDASGECRPGKPPCKPNANWQERQEICQPACIEQA